MNVRFGKELEHYIKAQVEAGSFADAGEFIGHCIREYRNAELSSALPDLRGKLLEGLRTRSYPANPKTLAADMQRRHRAALRKAV
jgi:Arc/MetJ-type ribon-helix-helix transcriptional regulator